MTQMKGVCALVTPDIELNSPKTAFILNGFFSRPPLIPKAVLHAFNVIQRNLLWVWSFGPNVCMRKIFSAAMSSFRLHDNNRSTIYILYFVVCRNMLHSKRVWLMTLYAIRSVAESQPHLYGLDVTICGRLRSHSNCRKRFDRFLIEI